MGWGWGGLGFFTEEYESGMLRMVYDLTRRDSQGHNENIPVANLTEPKNSPQTGKLLSLASRRGKGE